MIQFDNPVIVIGGDHHNTLAAVRCFGNYRLKVVLLGTNEKNTKVGKSRYAKNCTFVEEDENILIKLLFSYTFEKKAFIIPCSDFSMYVIDKHGEELSERYYLPGFKAEHGKVAKLMDKYEQKKFADTHGIPMAETWRVNVSSNKIDVPLPCILKPEISALGSKSDIRIAKTQDDFLDALKNYNANNYREVLCQKFLAKQYEACAYGVIPANGYKPHGVTIKKIHENHYGSTAYATIIKDSEIQALVDKLNQILQLEGYTGLYDYEFLVCGDGIYLNEINFRQSGNGYALINWGQPSPLIWANSMLGIDHEYRDISSGKHHLDDIGELINVKHGRLSMYSFLGELIKTHNCAVLNIRDIPGTIGYYKALLRK